MIYSYSDVFNGAARGKTVYRYRYEIPATPQSKASKLKPRKCTVEPVNEIRYDRHFRYVYEHLCDKYGVPEKKKRFAWTDEEFADTYEEAVEGYNRRVREAAKGYRDIAAKIRKDKIQQED